MIKNIDVTAYKNGNKLFKRRVELDLSNENKVSDLVQNLKSKVVEDIKNLEIEKEELFYGSQLMKLDETVPAKSGIELTFTVK